ncbi:helix-turn-helix domain-containing protein [Methylobacterium sp. V23]|uniref:helix-turn-helix domain-containing protein n=1 Tax=Methylobacterium sp. V23 TaxID=2044878 RepID=UPI000CDA172C|nr:helix-turn-helix domain-containing protein [Methylobacterium sp. V23]POR42661.1 hypothetical protein CRT23_12855 [Methylobacterium sp. V23]
MAEPQKGIPYPIMEALLAELDAVSTKIRAYAIHCAAVPLEAADNDAWPANAGHPDLITVAEGATILGCSTDTAYRYSDKHGLGKEYPVGWRMSHKRIAAFRRQKSAK